MYKLLDLENVPLFNTLILWYPFGEFIKTNSKYIYIYYLVKDMDG